MMAYQSISVDHHGDDQEAVNHLNGSSGGVGVYIRPQNQRRFFSTCIALALISLCYFLVHHNNGSISSSSIISTDSYAPRLHKQVDSGHLPPLPTGV